MKSFLSIANVLGGVINRARLTTREARYNNRDHLILRIYYLFETTNYSRFFFYFRLCPLSD